MEFSTASSVASTTASKSGVEPAPGHRGGPVGPPVAVGAAGRCRTPRKISPLPWWATEPGAGQAEPDPARQPGAGRAVDRRVGHHDADAGTGGRSVPGASAPGGSSRPTGTPSTCSSLARTPKFVISSTATVWPVGGDPRRGADAALEAEAGHAGAGPDRALGRRRSSTPREASAASHAARTSSAVTCIRRQSLRKESSHSATTGITTSSATSGCCSSAISHAASYTRPSCMVEVRKTGVSSSAPLRRGEEAGALAGAVEHGAARRHRPAVGVLGQDQRGHPGARDAAAGGGAGSSRHTVAWPRPTPATSRTELVGPVGQGADDDPQVAGAGHGAHPARRPQPRPWCGWNAEPMTSARRPGGLVAGDPAARAPARGVGRRADAGHRGAGAGRRDPRGARLAGRRPGRGRRRTTTPCCSGPCTTELRGATSRGAAAALGRRPVRRAWSARTGSCPYFFPTPAMTAGHAARAGRSRAHACAGRLLLRHDDAGRPGHLGGGPRCRRLRADRGRTWSSARRARGVRAVPAARPPRHAGRVRRVLLPQQRGRGRRGAARRRPRAGRRRRRRRPPRQRHRRRSSATRADVLYGSVHVDPGAGLVPARASGTPTRPGPVPGAAATRNLPAARGDRRRAVAGRRRRPGRTGSSRGGCTALVVSLGVDAAVDDPESPLRVTARRLPPGRGGCSAGTGLPTVVGPGGRLPPADASAAWSRRTSTATRPRRRFHRCARSGHVSAAARNDAACRSRHRARGSAPTRPRPRDRRGRHRRVRRTGRRGAPRGRARDPRLR